MGIADTIQIERDDWKTNDRKIQGSYPDGFDIVIDATGASSVIQEALKFTKRGAKLVIYGVCDESETITVSPYEIFEKELKIIGSFCQTHCFDRAVKYLEEGIVKVAPMITHSFSLDDYGKGLEIVMSGKDNIKVIINP
jgi:D-arabinitol dehydrogenase (NADP+)